jgi:hypothetical protein
VVRLLAASAYWLSLLCEWMGRKCVIGAKRLNAASAWLQDANCYLSGLGTWESLRATRRGPPSRGAR